MDLGLSQSTVADARARFAEHVCDGGQEDPKLLVLLNEAIERFHSTERWLGAQASYEFAVPASRYIYLPFWLDSILAASMAIEGSTNSIAGDVRPQAYQFLHDGPGLVTADSGVPRTLVDMGVSGISVPFPSTAGTITASAVAAGDVGETIRILGYDSTGAWVVGSDGVPGEVLTLALTTATTSTSFSAIRGIQKTLTRGPVTLTHSGGTVLATLENWMTNPRFRYYRVADNITETVTALCKRRAIPVNFEEDYLFPGELSALKLGILAINYENAGESRKAMEYFAEAVAILNQHSVAYRGGVTETLSFAPWGHGVSGITMTH